MPSSVPRAPTLRAADGPAAEPANAVYLSGRVADVPVARDLPSGDRLVSFRLVVPRGAGERRPPVVDTIDCSAWRAGVQRTVLRWKTGDVVHVRGRLHRRFWRVSGAPVSRYEVEVLTARRMPGSRGEPGSPAPRG
jgi:single-strand DNA-binding protein